ncbi:MAG: LpxI family protein [Paracoccaceae bacterium]
MPEGTLAILAGRDSLPERIAEDRRARGLPYLVIVFEGTVPAWVAGHPHQIHRFERVGRLFSALRTAGCTEVVFAGAMDRPRLRPWRADAKALSVAARVFRLLRQGDDGLLRGLGGIFEAEGLRLVSAGDCLPDLLAGPALIGPRRPSEDDLADARRATEILRTLGPLDVAQAAAVARGVCLGIEAIEGTDALLARIAALPPEKRAHCPPPSGVLVKLPKPGQDRRVDLPTIGPATLEGAARAGLAGIVAEADGTQLLDRPAIETAARSHRLFVWIARPEELA